MGASELLKKLEVKPTDDEYESIDTSRWGNKDVYPIPHDKRTYSWLSFYGKFEIKSYVYFLGVVIEKVPIQVCLFAYSSTEPW